MGLTQDEHQMDNASLNKRILKLKRELLNLRFQKAVGEAKNVQEFSRVRRSIARVKTVLSMRERAVVQGGR